jgi:PAS domain-containing protein
MTMPALALVGASGRIQHSTEPFRARCPRAGEICEELPQLDAVISGQADQAIVSLDAVEAKVEAIVDSRGSRCALMTLVAESAPAGDDAENAILHEPLDDSPAIVWLKDLEGRHMRVNRQFVSVLGGSEELIKGRTDAELPTAGTIDGPRLQDPERSMSEPVEFEYTVPAYQDRPALSAVRFLLHGRDGEPVAVCGVAAPLAHAEIAHTEASRLMRLDRWSWLDCESIRGELLEEWGVGFDDASDDGATLSGRDLDEDWGIATASDGYAEQRIPVQRRPDAEWEAEIAAAVTAREEAVSARTALEQQLSALEEQLAEARGAPEPADVNVDGDAAEAIAAARSEADAARNVAHAARAEAEAALTDVETARRETEAARSETEATRADVEAARSEAQAVRAELGTAHAAAEAARAEAQAAWAEADAERTNASTLAGQLADARRQLQHQRARVALAQQQLEIPRCTAAAQASRPAAQKPHRGEGAQILLRARQPVVQPLDPTVMSQPAPQEPAAVPASAHHAVAPHGSTPQEPRGLLGRFRSRRRR